MRLKIARKADKEQTQNAHARQHPNLAPLMNGLGHQGVIDKVLNLQRTHGNQFVQRLIQSGAIQTKLTVNRLGDQYEQEADRVAEKVMQMPKPTPSQNRNSFDLGNGLVQRKAERVSDNSGSLTDRFLHNLGSGQPLDQATRTFFESRFGYDFSHVQVHTNAQAAESARSMNALAFTMGRDIVFGAGQYSPEGATGKRLLAHELTHVVQQNEKGKALMRSPRHQPVTAERQGTKQVLIQRQTGALEAAAGAAQIASLAFQVGQLVVQMPAGGFSLTNVAFNCKASNQPRNTAKKSHKQSQTILQIKSIKGLGSSFAFIALEMEYDGKNILSAHTRADYVRGYDGGALGSEAGVVFQAIDATPVGQELAEVDISFEGFNNPLGPGFQRFNGMIRVKGDGTVQPIKCEQPQGDGIARIYSGIWCEVGWDS